MEEAMHWLYRYQRFWTSQLDRLAAFVEDNSWPPRRQAPAVKPSLTLKRRLNAAPEKVFAAWTKPERSALVRPGRMHSSQARRDRPAGRRPLPHRLIAPTTAMSTTSCGVYREIVPNQKLVFTWAWRTTPERESLVTVTFKPDGDGTLLTLLHELFFDEEARDRHSNGWTGTLDKLEKLFAWQGVFIMQPHKIVSRDEWLQARKALLAKEKELTRQRDRLSAERRELPWVKVDKPYGFDTPNGKRTLADLFAGRSQLIVYHFMLAPGWEEGCNSCSYLADHFDGALVHLAHRDVTWSRCRARRCRRSRPSSGAWAGGSSGCRPSAATSTATSTCRSRPSELAKGEAYYNYQQGSVPGRGGARRQRVLQGRGRRASSTPTRPMRAGSTSWSAPTTSSTWRPRAATRTGCRSPWTGSATTTGTSRRPPAATPERLKPFETARKGELPCNTSMDLSCRFRRRRLPAYLRHGAARPSEGLDAMHGALEATAKPVADDAPGWESGHVIPAQREAEGRTRRWCSRWIAYKSRADRDRRQRPRR